jgi:PST family polysaccharide transporter
VLSRLHFGAYAIIIPLVLVNAMRTLVMWVAAPWPLALRLYARRWRFVVGDSGVLLATSLFTLLVSSGDYLLLGYFHDEATVGIFYFAFNLSMQTLALLTVNLGGILFPALSKMTADPDRQTTAFLRAARVFAAVAIPLCLLQAAGSDAGVRLVFKPIWYPAIPVLAVLSVAMAIRAASMPAQALAAAQNRLRWALMMYIFNAIGFLSVVALAAWRGGDRVTVAVAVAELLFFCISDPIYLYLLIRMNGRRWTDALRVYAAPCVAGGIAAVLAYVAGRWVDIGPSRPYQALRLVVIMIVGTAVYAPLLRVMAPDTWQELSQRVRGLIARRAAQ